MRPAYQTLMAGRIEPQAAGEKMQRDSVAAIETLTSTVEPDFTAPLIQFLGVAALVGALAWQRDHVRRFFVDLSPQAACLRDGDPVALCDLHHGRLPVAI